MTLSTAALAILIVNLWTLVRFWQDKARARSGGRRIAEARLLGLALVGGTPAALLARRLFGHKTRKQPFSGQLLMIAAVQIGVAIAWLALQYRD